MSNSKIEIHDVITGEIIRRELNDEELKSAKIENDQKAKDIEAKVKAEEARDRKRQEVLDRLAITAEELKTILS